MPNCKILLGSLCRGRVLGSGWRDGGLVFLEEGFDAALGWHGNTVVYEKEAKEQQASQDDGCHVVDEVLGWERQRRLVYVDLPVWKERERESEKGRIEIGEGRRLSCSSSFFIRY